MNPGIVVAACLLVDACCCRVLIVLLFLLRALLIPYFFALLAEFYAELFSRHASPLEVYVFVAVGDGGYDAMPDDIRRVQRKTAKQRRRRSGCSVQLPDWFMILHSSSIHLCTHAYVRLNIFGEKTTPPGDQVSGWTCRTCVQSSGSVS